MQEGNEVGVVCVLQLFPAPSRNAPDRLSAFASGVGFGFLGRRQADGCAPARERDGTRPCHLPSLEVVRGFDGRVDFGEGGDDERGEPDAVTHILDKLGGQ